MVKKTKTSPLGLSDAIKSKLIEIGVDYFKKNIEKSKQEIVKYLEKSIEKKIKKEVKRATDKALFIVFVSLGALFVLYGIIAGVVEALGLAPFITQLVFGLLFLLVGVIFYIKSL